MRMFSALPLAAALALTGVPLHAGDTPAVTVDHAWVRLLPGTLPAGGYATVHNSGNTPRTVTGASSRDYKHVMLHQSTTQGGMSRMRMIDKLTVPAHATVKLTPGGYHLMLMNATHTIKVGDMIPVTLHFADGKTLTVQFKVRPANAH
ncbi:MAG TPA: copper chaperone PCu(A)C [Oleiagrimonas sp.]|nr:copper chaperone PCu(A)C [Oleiagrimonas sp.]